MTAPGAVLERPDTETRTDTGAGSAEPCIIQEWGNDPAKLPPTYGKKFLEVCTKDAIRHVSWTGCPLDCQGHPICQPCYMLGVREGMIR